MAKKTFLIICYKKTDSVIPDENIHDSDLCSLLKKNAPPPKNISSIYKRQFPYVDDICMGFKEKISNLGIFVFRHRLTVEGNVLHI